MPRSHRSVAGQASSAEASVTRAIDVDMTMLFDSVSVDPAARSRCRASHLALYAYWKAMGPVREAQAQHRGETPHSSRALKIERATFPSLEIEVVAESVAECRL